MFEELSEDGKLTEEAAIEIHELQDFIDCLFVMDALAQSMLLCAKIMDALESMRVFKKE